MTGSLTLGCGDLAARRETRGDPTQGVSPGIGITRGVYRATVVKQVHQADGALVVVCLGGVVNPVGEAGFTKDVAAADLDGGVDVEGAVGVCEVGVADVASEGVVAEGTHA